MSSVSEKQMLQTAETCFVPSKAARVCAENTCCRERHPRAKQSSAGTFSQISTTPSQTPEIITSFLTKTVRQSTFEEPDSLFLVQNEQLRVLSRSVAENILHTRRGGTDSGIARKTVPSFHNEARTSTLWQQQHKLFQTKSTNSEESQDIPIK